ncbi:hypothetical protein COU62_00910 [Candidatus Pacearchaeota archaeon CG10_big_fil_rev_8_21_14_0_10_35_219]|nr:hypothetical protein [Candidatus Pacearchaeota archaeon]OIO43000.1 MAG: hypothetical protein AUJ63_01080 [Candidatus Pacearchaeota archaeon CG1_02_35_32]PIO08125.1 MAG: hypothetical protein COU62_00910 [Candidatus Pacearchaeota archaeon CG10_big_fil_rev_8_21_14_0_10_35_219]PIY81059.1 MAG: hypothetical protein COY79_04620 [Candidatus Pacearchaeota archaeon CG_4_10_14_0_8_um_filter_35_169]PIZ79931.1 MAG: hypothetical protein COY00_02930 [Candidatus Pacearchaeota archaeon CG_4_10_14_0_2_um_filt
MDKKIIFLFVILGILVVALALFIGYSTESDNERVDNGNGCIEIGCPSAEYVGSINSDKYYPCDCRYAKTVKLENIVCFDSDQEAVDKGYEKSDC